MKDLIPGGLADNKSDKDFPKDQMRKGEKVESEHTSSKAIAKEIARDHLVEDKKYYDKLEKMEKKAFLKAFFKLAGMAEVSTTAIFSRDRMLWGKRRDNSKYTTPGGHLNPGEDPAAGAIREAKEESGIDIDPKDLKHLETKTVTKPDGTKIKVHAYRAYVGVQPTSMKDDPDNEVFRWNWIDVSNGLPKHIAENLHVQRGNVLLDAMGISYPQEKVAFNATRGLRRMAARKSGQEYADTDRTDREKTAMKSSTVKKLVQSGSEKRMMEHATKGTEHMKNLASEHDIFSNMSHFDVIVNTAKRIAKEYASGNKTKAKSLAKNLEHVYPKIKKEASMNEFLNGFTKQAASKSELKMVLKKHEERETPEQEAAESKEEQRIEREAGVEPEEAKVRAAVKRRYPGIE